MNLLLMFKNILYRNTLKQTNTKNKTIIFVWTTDVCNLWFRHRQSIWGIGDILRGMIATGILCKKKNYEFIIDIQKHPISKYLKTNKHKYVKHVEECQNIPFIMGNKLESYIKKNKNNVIILMTNKMIDCSNIDNEIKTMIQNIFIKNERFEEYYNKQKAMLNLGNEYAIFHFRLGDNFLVRNIINVNMFQALYNLYMKYNTQQELVMSDNIVFKQYIKKNQPDVKMYDIQNTAHIGYPQHENYLMDTLVEFFLVSESKSIQTFSVYRWISGFVLYPSIIYDIPLKELKL